MDSALLKRRYPWGTVVGVVGHGVSCENRGGGSLLFKEGRGERSVEEIPRGRKKEWTAILRERQRRRMHTASGGDGGEEDWRGMKRRSGGPVTEALEATAAMTWRNSRRGGPVRGGRTAFEPSAHVEEISRQRANVREGGSDRRQLGK
ncbi:hypothetical protein Scep_027854 [Stephania cephalantha]|uniref:Uncharacterized protein n=1 Tax=Stephania cephalantha TaxID=152367 RepID=A0AAP0EDE0_9MAGN